MKQLPTTERLWLASYRPLRRRGYPVRLMAPWHSQNGSLAFPEWQSGIPGLALGIPGMAVWHSRNGGLAFPDWHLAFPDWHLAFPEWRLGNLERRAS